MNYYNEFDPDAAAWLGELVASGNIPEGRVDDRSVAVVAPGDLSGYTQCHFFAGIGGWSYALRLAGWPDDQPVWTASLPCQPFSVAGKGLGEEDERHLWPVFRELVRQCLPPIIFGEQVASADGRLWLAGVRADLEGMGYAVAAADLCAASVGAPHIRQRLYWTAIRMADALRWGSEMEIQLNGSGNSEAEFRTPNAIGGDCTSCGLADTDKFPCGEGGPFSGGRNSGGDEESRPRFGGCGNADRLADGINPGLEGHAGDEHNRKEPGRVGADATGPTPEGGSLDAWSDSYLAQCRDGKVRRVGTGIFPLAHGLPRGVVPSGDPSPQEANASQEGRKTRLRGYGNAIVPQLAAEFIQAVMEFRVENPLTSR